MFGEQLSQFITQKNARQCLGVFAALVALCVGKLGQHHFRDAAVTLFFHQTFGAGQPLFNLAAFAFGIAIRLLFLGAADPVKTPMLAQVVDDASQFLGRQQTIESRDPKLPWGNHRRILGMEKPLVRNQAVVREFAGQFLQPPGALGKPVTCEASLASDQVERVAFFGGFGLVEGADAKVDDAIFAEQAPADRGDADVQPKGVAGLHDICSFLFGTSRILPL